MPRNSRETAEKQPRSSRETAEKQPRWEPQACWPHPPGARERCKPVQTVPTPGPWARRPPTARCTRRWSCCAARGRGRRYSAGARRRSSRRAPSARTIGTFSSRSATTRRGSTSRPSLGHLSAIPRPTSLGHLSAISRPSLGHPAARLPHLTLPHAEVRREWRQRECAACGEPPRAPGAGGSVDGGAVFSEPRRRVRRAADAWTASLLAEYSVA